MLTKGKTAMDGNELRDDTPTSPDIEEASRLNRVRSVIRSLTD